MKEWSGASVVELVSCAMESSGKVQRWFVLGRKMWAQTELQRNALYGPR
jgi:hypothetical protein